MFCNPVKNIVQLTPFFKIDSPHPRKKPLKPSYEYIFFDSFHSLDKPMTPFVFLNDEMLEVLNTSKGWVMTDVIKPISKFLRRSAEEFLLAFSIDNIISWFLVI